MSEARLLLVEKNSALADKITNALELESVSPLHAGSLADVKEALGLQQFDVILLGTSESDSGSMAGELRALARGLNPPVPVLSYGNDGAQCDAVIPASVPLSELAGEVKRLIRATNVNSEDQAWMRLPVFDIDGFSEQMGGDSDLMREIISIYLTESAEQLASLREAGATGEFQAASRLAHSIKGSLGSIHAPRARHWALAVEAAALASDASRYDKSLSGLEQAATELEPHLQQLLNS